MHAHFTGAVVSGVGKVNEVGGGQQSEGSGGAVHRKLLEPRSLLWLRVHLTNVMHATTHTEGSFGNFVTVIL